MILEKSFGEKINGVQYKDRVGAYAILVADDKVAVIKTQKGYFLPGGGLDRDETFEDCIKRECLEEVGMSVIVKNFICKGDKYSWIDNIGYMHAIGYFYFAQGIDIILDPIEKDHELVWLNIENCCDSMYLEHQAWAIHQAFMMLGYNNFKKIEDIKSSLNNKKVG